MTRHETPQANRTNPAPQRSFVGELEFLSNFYETEFQWRGRNWRCVETAFQAAKAVDENEFEKMASSRSPSEAKRRGRGCKLVENWDDLRHEIMAELLAAKFAGGSDLAKRLAGTSGELVENNNWGDRHWGKVNGRGENWLGRLLMARRAILSVETGAVVDTHVDLWDLQLSGAWVVVPTNRQRRANGDAVMGGGVAKTAAWRHPGLETRYGRALAAGNDRMAYPRWRILCVPTKDHWKNPSTIDLVTVAVDGVARWCEQNPETFVAVPALGCGLGGLDWEPVRDLLLEVLASYRCVLLEPK